MKFGRDSFDKIAVSFPTVASVPAATTVWGDLGSITLPPGHWDLDLMVVLNNNTCTIQGWSVGIGTASGTGTTGLVLGDTQAGGAVPTVDTNQTITIPRVRVHVAGGTTQQYYAKCNVTYSSGTPRTVCKLVATKVS